MQVKLFTHTDLDGIGCEIITKEIFGEFNVSVIRANYEDINFEVNRCLDHRTKHDLILITDISVSLETAERLDKIYKETSTDVLLADHHRTAKWLNEYDWAYVEEFQDKEKKYKESGTTLLLELLVDPQREFIKRERADGIYPELFTFAEQVRRYDTWEWKTRYDELYPKHLNDLFNFIGADAFIDRQLDFPRTFSEDEIELLNINRRQTDEYIEQKLESVMPLIFEGVKFGVVFADKHHSELGNTLCETFPEYDAAMIVDAPNKISLRTTKDNLDLGGFSSLHFNGGGHPQAAGAPFSVHVSDIIFNQLFKKERVSK